MDELKRTEAQRDDEVEIDLGEIFHLLVSKLWILVLWNKITDYAGIFSFINDLYFDEDNKCDISCGYPDGNPVDSGF